MKRAIWKWIALGATVSLLLVYFIELTSNGLDRMNGTQTMKAAYEQSYLDDNINAVDYELRSEQADNDLSDREVEFESEIAKLEREILALKKKALENEKKELEQLLLNEEVTQSNVNKLADSTSGALQSLSSSGLQFVAELFHKVIN